MAQNQGFQGKLAAEHREHAKKLNQQLGQLSDIAKALWTTQETRSEPKPNSVVRVEDIPGRRVPFDMIVDIPIGNNVTSDVEVSTSISQEGPFVAVKRFATFQSQLSFQVTVGTSKNRFNGRTFGRYRPIHSAWDIHDAQQPNGFFGTNPLTAGTTPGIISATSNTSGGRSMVFDGRVLFFNAGSSFPRSNNMTSVPTPFWTTQINSPQDLGALDFFERGEVLTWRVSPSHSNNPAFGNANGAHIFGTAGALAADEWPFLEGQFDVQEGIVTPGGISWNQSTPVLITTDSIQRLPDGILTIGFLGYRIIQPVAPVLG
jgi:hypothetical protein